MRGSPGAQLTIRLVSRIDVNEGDGCSVHGNGEFERKVAVLLPHGSIVDPARDQPPREAELFKKPDLFRLGGEPSHARMFQNVIEREQAAA